MRNLSRTFKALSEVTRLEILALLFRHGELCVCDVEGVLGVSQSKASRHVRYLLAAGLVEDRRDGLWVHYRLVTRPSADQRLVLDAVRALLRDERVASLEDRYQRWVRGKRADRGTAPTACRVPIASRARPDRVARSAASVSHR